MSNSKNLIKGKYRKRRNNINITQQTDINTSAIEDPHPAASSAAGNITEEPQRPIILCPNSKLKREYEKIVSETNHQRDLKAQLDLAAQQVQSDDSDDEPSTHRLRPNDVVPVHKSRTTVSSELQLDDHLQALNIEDNRETSVRSSAATNMDQKKNVTEGVRSSQSNNKLAMSIQRLHSMRASSSSGDIIPLPSTSSNTLDPFSLMSFEDLSHPTSSAVRGANFNEYYLPPIVGHRDIPVNTTISDHDENYVMIGLLGTRDLASGGDEEYRAPPPSLLRTPERLVESSDDEENQHITHNTEASYIDIGNRHLNFGVNRDLFSEATGHASTEWQSSWAQQQPHRATLGRTSPRPSTSRVAPRGMTYEELYPNVYYLLRNDELFYPVQITEQPTFLEYEQMIFSILPDSTPPPPPESRLRPPNVGWGPCSRNGVESPPQPQPQQNLSTASNSNTSGSPHFRFRSMSNNDIPMRLLLRLHLDSEDEDEEENACAATESTTEQTPLTRSTSIPDLNVIGICPICTNGLHKKEVASTFCGHLFCIKCIQKALIINGKRCPKCRHYLSGKCYHQVFF